VTGPKIFISYSHSDKAWATEFAKALQEAGLDVWFDDFRIEAGESLVEALEEGLRKSDDIVLLLSSDSIRKPNLFFEIGAALAMKKRIIPIVPQDLDASRLPLLLQRIKYLIRKSPGESAKEVANALDAIHGEAA
jgi:hypothetical protein